LCSLSFIDMYLLIKPFIILKLLAIVFSVLHCFVSSD
jgi:hypothetical protein